MNELLKYYPDVERLAKFINEKKAGECPHFGSKRVLLHTSL